MARYVVGLTGGVAAGKSTVERLFRARGIAVADADAAARDALAPGSPGLQAVVAAFGPQVLAADGALDRPAMRRRVFADDAARRTLEAIVHPYVRHTLQAACAAAAGPYALAAIPLLAEGGRAAWPWLARVLVVDVPAEVQLERLRRRDGIDAALAAAMLAAQAGREQRLAIADDVLANTGTEAALDAQVAVLDRLYRHLAALAEADPGPTPGA
ncbi:dephospho-CoA kinase [Thermomonas flagellata]|uniref:dephospho-CoA kinase n=1 Tax=Thermomonas flagellata TaxID=2888524 RepID=UPI001F039A37|nr:dephospho-CoA kinase [Thermomonas flagellata]